MMKGKKFDNGKLRYDLVPVEAHEALAEVFTYGANKYDDNNWQQVESNRYEAALFRHLNEYRKGNKYDFESGLSHLKHALTNVAILLYKEEAQANVEMEEMLNDMAKEFEHKECESLEERKEQYFTKNGTDNI